MILSRDENNILNLVIKGHTNIEIAEALNFSDSWVKKKLRQVFKTFGVKNKTGLIAEYYRYNYEKKLKSTERKQEVEYIYYSRILEPSQSRHSRI